MSFPTWHGITSLAGRLLREGGRALRPIWRRPAFALTAIVSLAVGIGAVTTVLSVVDALLIQPLPYADPARLVDIWPGQTFAGREIAAIRARSRLYDQVAGFSPGWLMTLADVTAPRQLSAARVSGNFFQLLGVAPLAGHTFGMESEAAGNDKVAVLSYAFWQSAFDGDPRIVGRSMNLSGTVYTIAAVMPNGFSTFATGTELWTPLTMDPSEMTWTGATASVYGKLARGATAAGATAEMRVLAGQMRTEFDHPPAWTGGARVESLQESMVGGVRTILLVLLAAVAFLLLIAVANVSNLFLVRTAERRQEMAVRTALGASSRQVATLLLGESVVLGVVGGACGIGLAYLGVGLLRRILPAGMPRLGEIAVDMRVLAIAVVITGLSAVVAGIAPSLQGLGTLLGTRIRAGRTVAGSGNGTRGALVAIEVALALVLTVGAAVMGRTLVSLHEVDRGLRTDHLLTMRLQPTAASNDGYRNYWHTVLGQLRGIPGVTGAATILHLPTSGRNWQADIEIEGRPAAAGEALPRAGWQSVSNDYFSTAGMPVLKGRAFDVTDGAGAPPVVALNSVLADALFPGENPVGKRIRAGFATAKDWATIVAVVSSVRHDSLSAPPAPELYMPFDQRVVVANSLVIRTAGDPMALAPVIRARVLSVDGSVPIGDVRTMDDLYAHSLQRQRMILTLFGLFAGAGLLLSAVGIYGVVAYGVRQRMNEIGIRVALGADAPSIRRLIVGQGVRYALAGIAVGVPVAIALSGFMRGMVFGVPATDPLSLALVPAFLVLVAAAASWIPARRAARADPCEVLRR